MGTEKHFLDYYYGDESNQFSFYRIPRQLITGDAFTCLSTDAKLLYGLLLDRMGLSAKHGWYDEQGRVYIYYTLEEIQADMNCGHEKAVKLLAELDASKGFGLIERVKQGRDGLRKSTSSGSPHARNRRNPLRRKIFPDFRFSEVKTSEKQKSRSRKNRSQHFGFSEVLTSENRTQVILNPIRLIVVSLIHLSIHHPPRQARD